jgi:hypothetical protein
MFATMLYKVITRFVMIKTSYTSGNTTAINAAAAAIGCAIQMKEPTKLKQAANVKLLGNSWHNSIKGSSRNLQHTKWSLK